MRLQLFTTLAAAVALAACESTTCEQKSGMYEWPATSTSSEGPIPGSADDFKKSGHDRVYFDFDKYNLRPDAQATVAAQAEWLKKWPSVNVIVEGHCDERGTTEYNMALGERRAHSVKKGLISHGIDAKRIDTVSYGKERPEVMGHDESAWAKNRRAVTVVR
jgi:peptidoglycan-associated lipoprotein